MAGLQLSSGVNIDSVGPTDSDASTLRGKAVIWPALALLLAQHLIGIGVREGRALVKRRSVSRRHVDVKLSRVAVFVLCYALLVLNYAASLGKTRPKVLRSHTLFE